VKPDLLLIVDQIEGPAGEHEIEQFWHLPSEDHSIRFHFMSAAEQTSAWRSRIYGQREEAVVLRVHRKSALPVTLASAVDLSDTGREHAVSIDIGGDGSARFSWPGG